MALASGIPCDEQLLETLRLVLAKIPPSELEDYARSTPAFSQGGFRTYKAPLVRARIASMLASSQPVDDRLRALLRDQVRRSLEAGGGGAALQRELETARTELAALRGANARLAKEKSLRIAAERKAAELQLEMDELQTERGRMRQTLESLEAEKRRLEMDAGRNVEALLQIRLAEEFASFLSRHAPPARDETNATVSQRLARAIAAANPRKLPSWRMAVELFAGSGVFTRDEALSIHAALMEAYSSAMACDEGQIPDKDQDPQSAGAVFMSALAGRIPAIIVIDGHNSLFSLQSRYRLPGDHRWPTAQARDWFARDLAAALDSRRNIRAYLVYDGPTVSESTAGPNVKVMYSGGEGEHRADGVIVDLIKFLSDSGCANLIVVSNDGELCGLASRHGALHLPPTSLLKILPA